MVTLAEVDTSITGPFTLTLPLLVLFVARALDGVTGGNVSVANAYLADVTTESDRSAGFGKMAVASNLGFVLGPAIAGLLGGSAMGEVPPVLAAIGVSVVATAIIFFKLQDSAPCVLPAKIERGAVGGALGQEHKECYEMEGPPASLREALRPTPIRVLLAIHFLVFLAFNFFYIAFPVHAATSLEWTLIEVGIFFSTMGLLMALVQGPVLSIASKRYSDRFLVIGGGLVLAMSFAFFASRSVALIYAGTTLLALGNGLMWPSLMAMIASAAGERHQGAVQGFASSSAAVASIAGLLLGGVLYGLLVDRVFLVAALITGIAVVASFGGIAKPQTE